MAESRFSFFFFGVGVGAALGFLFAPKSGDDLRRDLGSRATESRDYIRRRREDLRNQADDVVRRSRGIVQTQRERLIAALEAGRRAYREEMQAQENSEPAASQPSEFAP